MKRYYICLISFLLIIVNISCEKEVYTGTVEVEYYEHGKIFVDSKPTGAKIFVDNKNSGYITPDTIKWLSSGTHTITLKKYLFQDTSFIAQTKDKEIYSYFIDFTLNSKNFGKIDCQSIPSGSKICINDSLVNKVTPAVLSHLYPGIYKIKYSYENHRSDSTTILVKSNEIVQAFITLEDTSKWVSYNTQNSDILSDEISFVTHDKLNHIWIGTNRGINKFDGKNWEIYNTHNSPLQTDVINCITIDKDNKKWIGTVKGLYLFDDVSWTDLSNNLPSLNVRAIIFDRDSVAWVGTDNGLVKYNKSSWRIYNTSNSGLKENYITALSFDKLNRLWIGSIYSGLGIYDGDKWSNVIEIKIGNINYTGIVKSISADSRGNMWISLIGVFNLGSVVFYDGTSWLNFSNSYMKFNGTFFLYNYNDLLMFGTKNGFGILYSSNTFNFYKEGNYKLSYLRTESITVDNSGNLWLGTFGNGLAKLKKGNF